MIRCVLLLSVLLGACAPGPESARSAHSGIERHASGVARLDVDATTTQALVEGRIGVSPPGASGTYRCYGPQGLRRDGAEHWAPLTSVIRRDGDTPRVAEAWSFGTPLAYRALDRQRRGCDILWTGICLFEEKGEIRLSRADFERAASAGGMTLELSGFRGRYTGHVPAAAFAEVLARADRSMPLRPVRPK